MKNGDRSKGPQPNNTRAAGGSVLLLGGLAMQCLLIVAAVSPTYAESLPVTAFAREPAVSQARLSPDGRYVLFVSQTNDRRVVYSLDRASANRTLVVMDVAAEGGERFQECNWANETRIVCLVTREIQWRDHTNVMATLMAANADGTGHRNLFQGRDRLERLDELVDVTPHDSRSVLVQLDGQVYELDVYTRALRKVASGVTPMNAFRADAKGKLRLAYGDYADRAHVWVRQTNEVEWEKADSWRKHERSSKRIPRMFVDGSDEVYAIGPGQRHLALWKLDLSKKDQAALLYEDDEHDVADLLVNWQRKLLGVRLDTSPVEYRYVDRRAASVVRGAQATLAGAAVEIVDTSADESIYLLRSSSDVDAGTFHLLDARGGHGELEEIGTAYPELKQQKLSRAQSRSFRARDGVSIDTWLTEPLPDASRKHPLVVVVQPSSSKSSIEDFSFIRHFLSSRGYAVLEVKHRGPSFSWSMDWFDRSKWERPLAHTDTVDAVRAILDQTSVNQKRVTIVGWGEGGRIAMRAMQKEPTLFGCAISIAGISDFRHLASRAKYAPHRDRFKELVEADSKWLEGESPVMHARESIGKTLLVHGAQDAVIPVGHSRAMARELQRHKRKYQFEELEGANHEIDDASDRAALLMSIESFLEESCSPADNQRI